MQDNYADSMLIGLRRIVDRRKGVHSATKLLEELERGRPLVTFQRFLKFWGAEPREGRESFARYLFSRISSDEKTIDKKKVRNDVNTLLRKHEELLGYIGASIAHRARRAETELASGPSQKLTWEHLDALFEDVARLLNRYYMLVKPGTLQDPETILPAGFERAFHRMLPSCDD